MRSDLERECRVSLRPYSFVARKGGSRESPMVCVLWLEPQQVTLMAFAEPMAQDVALSVKQVVDNSTLHIAELKSCGAWAKANEIFDLMAKSAPVFKDEVAWQTATVVRTHVALRPNTADIRVACLSNPGLPTQGQPQDVLIRLDEVLCHRFVQAILDATHIDVAGTDHH